MRAKSYLTHRASFPTGLTQRARRTQGIRHLHHMKYAALATAFVIGFVLGISIFPQAHDFSDLPIQAELWRRSNVEGPTA